jgi:hypothetical protein
MNAVDAGMTGAPPTFDPQQAPIDWRELEQFLQAIGRSTGPLVLALFPPDPSKPCIHFACDSVAIPKQTIEATQRRKPELALGLVMNHPLQSPANWGSKPEHLNKSGNPKAWGASDSHISQAIGIWGECDGGLSIEQQQALPGMAGLPEPTLTVWTGGKSLHLYWLLEPGEVLEPGQFRELQRRLRAALANASPTAGADSSIQNPARLMRAPGGIHPATGNRCTIHGGSGKRFTVAALLAMLPAPEPAPCHLPGLQQQAQLQDATPLHELLPKELERLALEGAEKGGDHGRNNSAFKLAAAAYAIAPAAAAAGLRVDGSPESLVLDFAARCRPPLEEREAMACIESARGRNPMPDAGWPERLRFHLNRAHQRPQPTLPMNGEVFIPLESPSAGAGAWQGQQAAAEQEAPRPQNTAEKLQLLTRTASRLLADRVAFASRLPILRADAQELGLSIRDQELQAMLTAARRQRIHGDSDVLGPGDVLEGTPAPWAWDGLILRGCLNLLVALPKQGKTALAVAMVAAWWRNEPDALGRLLIGPCPPVLIVGTDQGSRDWRRMLEPAGLVDHGGRIGGPIVGLAHAGKPIHLDSEGIDRIAAYAQQHPGLLVLIDSLHACIAPLGLREESPEVAMPVAELMEQLEPHSATVILIHHASKGRAGEGASSASRGSTALPALASQILKLGPASENPTDHRRILQTQGREGAPQTLVIRREGAAWELLGGIEELEREQTTGKTIEALSDVQHRALVAVCDYWEDNGKRIGAPQLARLMRQGGKNPADVVLRALHTVVRRGLLQSMKEDRPGLGGRFYTFWPTAEALQALSRAHAGAGENRSDGSDGSDGPFAREDPEQVEPSRFLPSDPTDRNDKPTKAPARKAGKRSVGRSVGSGALQQTLLPVIASPIGSGADVQADGEDDPAWGERPQAAA